MPRPSVTWPIFLVLTLLFSGVTGAELPTAPIDDHERTEVLILGTEHLSGLGASFDRSMLDDVLAALERYEPDAVAVEQLPPRAIAELVTRASTEPGGAASQLAGAFCPDATALGADAQAVLGQTWTEARAVAGSLLALPEGAAERAPLSALVTHLLAAYDVPSGLLHWTRGAGGADSLSLALSDESMQTIRELERSANEFVSIGVALAARLGHRRVYSIDDHTDDLLGLEWGTWAVLGEELPSSPVYVEFVASPYVAESRSRLREASESGNLLGLMRRLNSQEHGQHDVESQWHLFYETRLPSGADRTRVSLWEARNLSIAARIMEVCSAHAGGRVLVVIGAAHKPFLEACLGSGMDVSLVSFESLVSDMHDRTE